MNQVFGRILSAAITASGWLILGARSMLDLVGYATLPDDAKVATGLLQKFFNWLLSVPWWAVFGFAIISTLWLMWVSWPRSGYEQTRKTEKNDSKKHENAPLLAVHDQFFANQKVVLDGKSWTHCTFESCSLIYNGKGLNFSDNKIVGSFSIGTENPEAEKVIRLLHSMGVLKMRMRDPKGSDLEPKGFSVVRDED